MTPQEILDTSYKALVAQGSPAKNSKGYCTYYDESTGHRCAVGLLVSEEQAKNLPQVDIYELNISTPELPTFFLEYEKLLADIQDVHDNYDTSLGVNFHDYLKVCYKDIADAYELDTKEIV